MGDRRRLYNLQSSRGDGHLVQSVSDDYDDEDLLLSGARRQPPSFNYIKVCVVAFSVVVVFFSGFFSHSLLISFGKPSSEHKIDNIGSVIDPSKIKEYHIELTKSTHLAGSQRNYELAQYIANQFHDFAFDNVELKNYSIRLPFPDEKKPNAVKLFDSSGEVQHTCRNIEVPLNEFEKNNPTTPLFNAHSKPGSVRAPYLYVNFAEIEDFKLLKENNITVKDKVVLARYGQTFRGNKVKNAADAGALAIVLFKDLLDPDREDRFPLSEFAPSSAGERGTIGTWDGDTDTPGWPSVQKSFFKADGPKLSAPIISQPITGDDAEVLLNALATLDDFDVPKNWQPGLLKNKEFGIGTGAEDGPQLEVTVNVDVRRVNITNVVGTITGYLEPDRWVILGNHRDAWTYGAIDPGSGTAAVIETARALGHFLNKGWRPRRTIKIASWDAEEWGLIGSLEWVEEKRAILKHRGVVYINTDIAEGGNCMSVDATGSPLYENITGTVLNTVNSEEFPKMELSGSGSDMYGFYCYAGVSVVNVNCASYSDVYHSLYDERNLFDIVDKDYKNLAKIATSLAQLVVGVSEPAVIPGRIVEYGNRIQEWWDVLKPKVLQAFTRLEIDEELIHIMDDTLFELGEAANDFKSGVIDKLNSDSTTLEIRRANDKMMQFDRAFLVDEEIPGTMFYSKNILVSPSSSNLYTGSGFPGLLQAVSSPTSTKKDVLLQLERIRWALNAATAVLKS